MTIRQTTVLACLLAAAAHAAALDAQTVRGSVWDEATGDAVAVAMVVLEDVAGTRAAMALSNDRGLYLLRAPGPGRYRVRVERIGFRSHTTDPFELGAGEDRVLRLGVRTEAVRLDGIVVAGGEARCRLPRQEGELLSDLWEEARKSLELAVWAEDERGAHVRVRSHERVLDLVTGDVLEERARSRSGMTRAPFFARPADELARDGYVVEDEEGAGFVYYGLSAETILSDAFQETHCFRVRRPGRGQSADEIGLAFEPAPGRWLPDVAGVLWLDRTTAELKRVEYNFTRHLYPVDVPLEPFGGRTDFRRLANGAVVIESWWIRMPRFQRSVTTDQLPTGATLTVAGRETERERVRQFRRAGLTIREDGAVAVTLALPGGAPEPRAAVDHAAPATAVIHGVVHDSLTGGPLVGAEVFLADRHSGATTDDAGRFVLDAVPPGDWRLAFQHPSLDALGVAPGPWSVSILAGDTVRFDLATPSAATVLGARCPAGGRWIVGFVRDRDDGSPVAGALVTAEWVEQWRREGDHGFTGERFRHGAITDEAGAYAVCDVRPGMRVRVQVEIEGGRTVRREVEVREGGGGRADFLVDPRAGARPRLAPGRAAIRPVAPPERGDESSGRVLGRVTDAGTGEPLAGVQVELRAGEVGEIRITDDAGRFLFLRAPPGPALLRAERLGYGAAEGAIEVAGGESLTAEVALSVDPVSLEPLTVSAVRMGRLADFHYRAGRGFGSFIMRDEIERRMPLRLGDMMAEHHLDFGGSGWVDVQLVNRRLHCGPMVYLDGVPLTRVSNRRSTAAMFEAGEALVLISPSDVEGVEIYRGPSTVPGEFGGSTGGCGAVVIWTRRGATTSRPRRVGGPPIEGAAR